MGRAIDGGTRIRGRATIWEDYDLVALHREHGSQRAVSRALGRAQGGLSEHLSQPGNEDLKRQCLAALQDYKEAVRKIPPMAEIIGAGPDVEPDVEEIRRSAERRFQAKAQRANEKERQTIDFPHGPICLYLVGDQHIGGEGTDIARIFREQEMMLETPGAYVWQTGDGVDSYVIGRLIKENWNPSIPVYEQWILFRHYLNSFGGRLVAYNRGNHEGFVPKVMGVDYAREVCPGGVLYDSDEISVTVHVGDSSFRLLSRHRWSGKSMYSQTHGQERAARFSDPDHDVYIGAHSHTGAVAREFIVGGSRKIAIQTGTYKVIDAYAREKGFPKHDSSTACALVMNDTGSFWATASIESVMEFMQVAYSV